jgi:hypothetical protein
MLNYYEFLIFLMISLDKLLLSFELEDYGIKFDENDLILKSTILSKLLLIYVILSFALIY